MKLLLVVLCLVSARIEANETSALSKFLKEVKSNSLQIKSFKDNSVANELSYKANLSQFDMSGYASSSYSKQETPPLSPFTSLEQETLGFEVGVLKEWERGFKTSLSYSLRDNTTLFNSSAATPEFAFISPTLEFKFETRVFQDLIGGKNKFLSLKNKSGVEFSKLESESLQKEILVKALFDYSLALEDQKKIKLQVDICREIQKQSKQLDQKYRRKSISKRELLQSKKELNNCKVEIETLKRDFNERRDEFEATYSFNMNKYLSINAESLYDSIYKLYKSFSRDNKEVQVEEISTVKVLELQKKMNELELKELQAESKTDLKFELRAGAVGVDEDFQGAQDKLGELDNPYLYAGLTLNLPFSKKESKVKAIAKKYRLLSIDKNLQLKKKQIQMRVKTLTSSLSQDLKIMKEYQETLKLSQDVYKEALKDFENGRLNFNNLIEFNKDLINDQKQLSSQRIQVIVRSVELLDYYQFFNRFISNQSRDV